MPELPEVEATRQNLERWTRGRRITALAADDAAHAALAPLIGRHLLAWHRRGKALAASTDDPATVLSAHLGMTGRWLRDPAPDRRHLRLTLTLEGPVHVAFQDLRRFGSVYLAPSLDAAFAGLGPDAWDTPLAAAALARAMGHGQTAIKTRLMDQHRVAGLGNIAVLEGCFRARLHPHTPVDAVSAPAWRRLAQGLRDHLAHTLSTTLGHDEIAYVSEGGDNPFLVYARAGAPCPTCATPIERALHQGRPSFWCPRCQPLPKNLDNRASR